MDDRLRADFRVQAMLRRCAAAAVPAMVVRRGHESAGAILIKVSRLDGTADVYTAAPGPAVSEEGVPRWVRATGKAPVSDADAEAYAARRHDADPDIWVIEVEDREGRPFLDGQVEDEPPPPHPAFPRLA